MMPPGARSCHHCSKSCGLCTSGGGLFGGAVRKRSSEGFASGQFAANLGKAVYPEQAHHVEIVLAPQISPPTRCGGRLRSGARRQRPTL